MAHRFLLGLLLLAFLLAPALNAEVCVQCSGDTACVGSVYPGNCCCTITYQDGNLTCTSWCNGCSGLGQPTTCPYACQGCWGASRFDGTKVAAADASAYAEALDDPGFRFTPAAFEKLFKRAPLVAMVLKNLSSDCKANAPYAHVLSARDAPFMGNARVDTPLFSYKGNYSGKLTASERVARLEIVLGAEVPASKPRRIRAEVSPDGDLRKYGEATK
jgi:hypothetical protein